MRTLLPTLFAASLIAAPAMSQEQEASAQVLETVCDTSLGYPQILVNSLPILGEELWIDYEGPNRVSRGVGVDAWPVFTLGFTPLQLTIPDSILPLQPKNCVIASSQEIVVPMLPRADCPECQEYEASMKIKIPDDPILLGLEFYAQWLVAVHRCESKTCTATMVATSSTLFGVVGN